ncbi:MAG: response regulator [Planctomycetota bacterium]|nr:response regulator [Planctomycetota bacterium]
MDDDEEIIEAISTRLRAAGYDCVTADNGEDGFSRFQAGDIDLVITDVIMPASDGFNMTEWIRQVSDVPIIVLTAYEQCREPFLHDFPEIKFLTKPYHSDGLLRMVEVELSGRNKTTIKIKRSNHGKTKDSNR